jgi:hypothetical protein
MEAPTPAKIKKSKARFPPGEMNLRLQPPGVRVTAPARRMMHQAIARIMENHHRRVVEEGAVTPMHVWVDMYTYTATAMKNPYLARVLKGQNMYRPVLVKRKKAPKVKKEVAPVA